MKKKIGVNKPSPPPQDDAISTQLIKEAGFQFETEVDFQLISHLIFSCDEQLKK
jgi:hypothetical protein